MVTLRKNASSILGVFAIVFFFFLLFAIFGERALGGSFRRRCITNDTVISFAQNSSYTYDPDQNPVLYAEVNDTLTGVTSYPMKYCGQFQAENGDVLAAIPYSPAFPLGQPKGYSCPVSQTCVTGESDPDFNGMRTFDDILSAFVNVFLITSCEGWSVDMYRLQDSENQVWVPFYYLLTIIVLHYVMIDLFIAVVSEAMSDIWQQDSHQGHLERTNTPLLNDTNENWVLSEQTPHSRFGQQYLQKMVTHRVWEHAMMLIITADVLAQATRTASRTDTFLALLDWIELGFTFFFAAEALIKLAALGRRYFFSHRMIPFFLPLFPFNFHFLSSLPFPSFLLFLHFFFYNS